MGGCQNYGPFLGTPNIRCRIIIGIQKGPIILTITYMYSFLGPCMTDLLASIRHHAPDSGSGALRLAGAVARTVAAVRDEQAIW